MNIRHLAHNLQKFHFYKVVHNAEFDEERKEEIDKLRHEPAEIGRYSKNIT